MWLPLLLMVGLVPLIGQVSAGSAEAAAGPVTQRTGVTADVLPTVQIDGVVWKTVIAGEIAFAGGQFTTARPAGAAPGTNTVARSNLLAFNVRTGALVTSFAPTFNGIIKTLALSPDKSILYVGGQFTQVNGQNRYRVAAFNVATGALTSFGPSMNASVFSIAAVGSTVYLGGSFTRVGSTARTQLAAVSAANGALLPWAPAPDRTVNAVAPNADGSRVIVAGNFATMNGVQARGLATVDASGATVSMPANQVLANYGDTAAFTFLNMDPNGQVVYGGGFWFGGTGNFEGIFAVNTSDGTIKWLADCHGDTYDAVRGGDTVYGVSHYHHCENIGAFPDTNPRNRWMRANAFTVDATGTVNANNQGGYGNFEGQGAPSMVHWFPDVAAGTFTGQTQGGWTVAATDEYVVMGGEFPTVNGTAQQGLARFAVPADSTNNQGPRLSGSAINPAPFAVSTSKVRVKVPANWDRDDKTLTYELFREGTAAAIATQSVDSSFWSLPSLSFDDTSVAIGQTYRYRVRTSDPDGNSVTSSWVSVTVPSSISPYVSSVFDADPAHYWRMGAPSTFSDYAGNSDLTSTGTVTTDSSGAISGDAGTTFNGSNGTSGSGVLEFGPTVFTVEAWFKTSSNVGGKIVGFGNSKDGLSGSYDRHVYMENSGRITFGVYPGGVRTVTSGRSYNDGNWHHVVASLGSNGMALYLDGLRVAQRADTTTAQPYSGYWRVGGDNLGGWPNQPGSNYFSGSIDEVAVYPSVLSIQQVQGHYEASGRELAVPAAPTDAYGQAVYADNPVVMWRFNEESGSTAADSSRFGNDGTLSGGVTRKIATTVAPGYALELNGSDGLVASNNQFSNPQVYSTELWFKTSTTTGGKLIGFGNAASGLSSNYDRHIYMEDSGQLTYGIWDGASYTTTSSATYNDNKWHYVVGTKGADGIKLYVDGQLVGNNSHSSAQTYDGYWRIGYDSPWNGRAAFAGQVDEAAVYDQELSAGQVQAHFAASPAAPNATPVAAFDYTCDANGTCAFTSTSSDPDGTLATQSWNFGDSTPAGSGAQVNHTFAASGAYQVALTVTDNRGATATKIQTVNVTVPARNVPPTADFTSSCTELSCAFTNGSTDSDGTIASVAWDFGDGQTSTETSPHHDYAANGTYQVKLVVTDNRGGTDEITKPVTVVGNEAPTADFTKSCQNLDCSFTSTSTDTDGTVVGYAWDFGDGGTSNLANPTHSYAAGGTFTVKLVVTDDDGATSAEKSVSVVVSPANTAPTAAFSSEVTNLKASFDASGSSDADGTIASYAWDFGDDEVGTGKTPTHTYDDPGTYDVTLTVTDDDGATDQVTHAVTVTRPANQDPTAAFSVSADGLSVEVNGSNSSDPDGSIASYAWEFGDNGTGTGATRSHTYASAGTYTIKLTVTDNDGATDSVTHQVTVSSVLVSDDFNRSVTRWGNADTGGAWTYTNGGIYSTDGTTGRVQLAKAGTEGIARLTQVSAQDVDFSGTLALTAAPSGSGVYNTFQLRLSGTSAYQVKIQVYGDRSVRLGITRLVNGTATSLGDQIVSGLTYNDGDTLKFRVTAVGDGTTTITAKAWKGASEPGSAQLSRNDSTASLQRAGGLGVVTYLGSSATTIPVTVRYDNFVMSAV